MEETNEQMSTASSLEHHIVDSCLAKYLASPASPLPVNQRKLGIIIHHNRLCNTTPMKNLQAATNFIPWHWFFFINTNSFSSLQLDTCTRRQDLITGRAKSLKWVLYVDWKVTHITSHIYLYCYTHIKIKGSNTLAWLNFWSRQWNKFVLFLSCTRSANICAGFPQSLPRYYQSDYSLGKQGSQKGEVINKSGPVPIPGDSCYKNSKVW